MSSEFEDMKIIPSELLKSVSLKRKNPSDSPNSAAACPNLGLLNKTFRSFSASLIFSFEKFPLRPEGYNQFKLIKYFQIFL